MTTPHNDTESGEESTHNALRNPRGWIALHRKLLIHPRTNDLEWFKIWITVLLMATHTEQQKIFRGKVRILKPGQLITSRESLAEITGIHESTVERRLEKMKSEQQIEQESDGKCRLITIVNWGRYQKNGQQNEQLPNNWRTTGEQLPNTHNNAPSEKKEHNKEKRISKQAALRHSARAPRAVGRGAADGGAVEEITAEEFERRRADQ